MNTAVGRLVRTELKLMVREPLALTFVFVFPVVTMLIIGGAFRDAADFGVRLGQPLPLVRRLVPHSHDRRHGADHGAGAPRLVP